MSICLEISKVHGNSLAMLGSLVVTTIYTNTFTIGQLKLRLDLKSFERNNLLVISEVVVILVTSFSTTVYWFWVNASGPW